MLTTFDDEGYVVQALRAGAVGYLLMDLPAGELATAVRLAHAGVGQLDSAAVERHASALARSARPGPRQGARERAGDALTAREIDVLRFIAGGSTNREIAAHHAVPGLEGRVVADALIGAFATHYRCEQPGDAGVLERIRRPDSGDAPENLVATGAVPPRDILPVRLKVLSALADCAGVIRSRSCGGQPDKRCFRVFSPRSVSLSRARRWQVRHTPGRRPRTGTAEITGCRRPRRHDR